MKKLSKKMIFISLIVLIIVIFILYMVLINTSSNFIKLDYNEVMEKIENKETFILCITATNCSHCKNYKPKLKKVSYKYDVLIYYTDIDTFTKEDYKKFKEDISFDGGTPTTVFFKNGMEETTATRIDGDVSMDRIVDKLKKNGFITEK